MSTTTTTATNVTESPIKPDNSLDNFTYTEPRYPITRLEKFDEDNMKGLLSDEEFAKDDRKKLSMYNKHRISGGRISVTYKFGKGLEDLKLGRLFPEDGLGLQAFRFDMRNPLASKNYWDTDVDNCHYRIALHIAKQKSLTHEAIEHYVTHRDECLRMVSKSRKVAKTEFLKTLYLGNIQLYKEHYKEVHETGGEITPEGNLFLVKLTKEVETLALVLWDANPDMHKLKSGGENKPINKRRNPKASLMSLLFQEEERKILMVWDQFLAHMNRTMAVFIHDGGLVEKLPGETAFPKELLEAGAQAIKKTIGYDVVLTEKPVSYDWVPPTASDDIYGRMKMEFEKSTFAVGNKIYHIQKDGYTEYISPKEAEFRFAPLTVRKWVEGLNKMADVNFVDLWTVDPNRRAYERVDFFPNESRCPSTVYNLFNGFNATKFRPDEPMQQDEIDQRMAPIIKHLDYLTKGHSGHMLKWLANIIQHPDRKSETAILIRDIGDMLCEGGGTGKNLFLEYFGYEILGEEYCLVVGDNKELYGSFNSMFEGKLLVFVEEACSKDNHANNDILKSKITSKKVNVNKKCVAQYVVNDYANYVFTSNNRNPLPIKQGNRRFWVFDTNPEKRGDVKYFEELSAHLAEDATKWAFYQYLKTTETYQNPAQFSRAIPITEAYREVRQLNAPLYVKWLLDCVNEGMLVSKYTSELYRDFTEWVVAKREKTPENVMSQTAFGTLLSSSVSIQNGDSSYAMSDSTGTKTKRNGSMFMSWDVPAVVRELKKLHLLEEDFVYEALV